MESKYRRNGGLIGALTLVTILFLFTMPTQASDGGGSLYLLNDTNFDMHVRSNSQEAWFVMFYAPWCGHCQKLHPIWLDLAKFHDPSKVSIGQVNCDENPYLKDRFTILGFPSLIFFYQGKMYEFDGRRDLEKLKEFSLGGYKYVSGEDIPYEASTLNTIIKVSRKSLERFIEVFRKDPTVAWGVVIGGALLMVLSCLCSEWILKKMEQRYADPANMPAPRPATQQASTAAAAPSAPVTAHKDKVDAQTTGKKKTD